MIEPKTDAVKSASPEETRSRIINAAREVIARKGKRGATTREIADVAGVNEATLFRHFGTKESLIVAVARFSCPEVALRDTITSLEGPLEEQLYVIAQAFNERLESMMDMVRWSLVEVDYEKSLFAQEAWRPQTAIHAVMSEYMAAQVKAGRLTGEPDELASVFMGMIFARSIAREKFPENRIFNDTEYALRYFIEVFLNGVRSKNGHA